jgi:putative transposase
MSSSYTCLRYHLIFSTKGRQLFLRDDVELLAYKALHRRAYDIGTKIIALNGVADHVHMVAAIPPTLRVSDFVREIKTASTKSIRKLVPHLQLLFEWQLGYGAFTIDPDAMGGVIAYVQHQKQHHAANTLIGKYEKTSDD